jgi:hypothetical protein
MLLTDCHLVKYAKEKKKFAFGVESKSACIW